MADGYLNLPGGSGNFADTPDHADFDVLGDIDIQVELALDDWTPAAIQTAFAKWTTTANQRGYNLLILTTGVLRLQHSVAGSVGISTDSTAATGFADGSRWWIRVTMDVDNGSAQRVVKFYTSPDGSTWTQLGATVTTAGTTSIANTTALPAFGATQAGTLQVAAGKVYRARLRNGYDGAGTLKASPDFTGNAGGTTYTDPEGHVWTVRGTATLVAGGTHNITATGVGAGAGSLAATVLRQATASGAGASGGSLAALAQRQAGATGAGTSGGQLAAARRLAASLAGAGASGGALAAMVERQAAASGAGLSGGQLAALRRLQAAMVGAGTSGGSLHVLGENNAAATGSGAGGGALDAVLLRYIAAAGAGAGGGSLAADRLLALSASGAGLSGGQLAALRLVVVAASGAGQSGGALAMLRLLSASASGGGDGDGSLALFIDRPTASRSRVTSREPSGRVTSREPVVHASTRSPATRVTVSEP